MEVARCPAAADDDKSYLKTCRKSHIDEKGTDSGSPLCQGLVLQSSYHGVHQVSGVRALSPAYQCGKLQEGDELVQVNYQTVVSLLIFKPVLHVG